MSLLGFYDGAVDLIGRIIVTRFAGAGAASAVSPRGRRRPPRRLETG